MTLTYPVCHNLLVTDLRRAQRSSKCGWGTRRALKEQFIVTSIFLFQTYHQSPYGLYFECSPFSCEYTINKLGLFWLCIWGRKRCCASVVNWGFDHWPLFEWRHHWGLFKKSHVSSNSLTSLYSTTLKVKEATSFKIKLINLSQQLMQRNKIAWPFCSTETPQLMSWRCTVSIYFGVCSVLT